MKYTVCLFAYFIMVFNSYSQGDIKDGKKYFHKSLYENGSTKAEGLIRYERKTTFGVMNVGKRYGKWVGYYENGQRKYVVFYKRKKRRGDTRTWYMNGQLKEEGIYGRKNHNISYRLVNYWDVNGIQKVIDGTGTYRKEAKDGGGRVWTGAFENYERIGTWTLVYPDGRKTEWKYMDGEKTYGYLHWDKDGKPIEKQTY